MTATGGEQHLCPHYDHYSEDIGRNPHPFWEKMRSCCPVSWAESNGGFWALSTYEVVERVAKDTEAFSNRHVAVPRAAFDVEMPPVTLDPPRHSQFRKLLLPAFSPKVVALGERATRKFAASLVADFVGRGECDVAHDYARRIPTFSMARILGVPMADEDKFTTWVNGMVERPAHIDPESFGRAAMEMMAYVGEQVEQRKKNPGDDLLSELLRSVEDGQKLTEQEVMNAGWLFLLAGIESTWSVLGSALWHLAQHPEDRRRLVEATATGDEALWGTAVEEFLRFYSSTAMARVVRTDTQVGDKVVRAGDMVQLIFQSANRDPAAFEDADRVVLDRQVNRHLAFGAGAHHCLGAGLARMMMKVGLEEWLRAIPEFHLEDPDDVLWSIGSVWGPRRARVRIVPARLETGRLT